MLPRVFASAIWVSVKSCFLRNIHHSVYLKRMSGKDTQLRYRHLWMWDPVSKPSPCSGLGFIWTTETVEIRRETLYLFALPLPLHHLSLPHSIVLGGLEGERPNFRLSHPTETVLSNKITRNTVWGGRLGKRFCNMFSGSSPCLLGQHGSCSSAQLSVELSENI